MPVRAETSCWLGNAGAAQSMTIPGVCVDDSAACEGQAAVRAKARIRVEVEAFMAASGGRSRTISGLVSLRRPAPPGLREARGARSDAVGNLRESLGRCRRR